MALSLVSFSLRENGLKFALIFESENGLGFIFLLEAKLTGGNNRARTYDPLLVRQMLSQLSYASDEKRRNLHLFFFTLMERITGLEPATSTLARSRSTK